VTTPVDDDDPLDLIWGRAAIAKAIGRPERATFHMIARGYLPAKRIGGRWVASRRKLIEVLTNDDESAA